MAVTEELRLGQWPAFQLGVNQRRQQGVVGVDPAVGPSLGTEAVLVHGRPRKRT